jgi:hypothetical protein
MEKTWVLFLLSALTVSLKAQEKYDYVWLFGYAPEMAHPKLGGSRLDFNLPHLDTSSFFIPFRFQAISMISNSKGGLLFYTNGCQIANADNQIMANGNGLNPGIEHDIYCSFGYPRAQGVLSLPWPDKEGKYLLFHTQFNQDNSEVHDLRYTTINMDTLDGLGAVVAKNQPLIVGEPLADMLTAVRHGNGRDWWIIMPRTLSNTHYLFLLTPQGIQGPFVRNFGEEWDYRYYRGHAVFSPDGKKYIRANPSNGLRITDFDRCTGEFSNPISIPLLGDSVDICGVAVSPNSRRLYLSTGFKLWQYDLDSSDVAASAQLVGEYDGFQSPFNTTFYQPMLAPDGKIYMTCTNGVDVLHIIHNPDAEGLACEFQQHGLSIPTYHAFMAPNFPHYRLYDVPGSICDSLGIDAPMVGTGAPILIEQKGMRLWPNPANDQIAIQLSPESAGQITLMDISGKIWVRQTKAFGTELVTLQTETIPVGIYILTFQASTGVRHTRKIVIQR